MEKDIILRAEDLHQLNLVLTTILDSAQAELIMIINKSGRLITWQGETSTYDTISIAALITGSFASSGSVANLIGEDEFESMYQEGKNSHVYISQIDSSNILTLVFTGRTKLNRVKLGVENHRNALIPTLSNIYQGVHNDPFLNLDVSGYQQ
jgi:predicted regulator of Ras-like GTPase activity (Roadblock/LC7/MglB family)